MCSRKDDMSRMCYRYPKLHVSYDIDEELLEFSVPNFILQPIVENSLNVLAEEFHLSVGDFPMGACRSGGSDHLCRSGKTQVREKREGNAAAYCAGAVAGFTLGRSAEWLRTLGKSIIGFCPWTVMGNGSGDVMG